MRDFLRSLRRHRTPPKTTPPPIRKTHLPHHAVAHLRTTDGRTCVSRRLALDAHLFAQLTRHLRRFHRHLKFRALVFLHAHARHSVRRARRANTHLPHEPVARCGEAAAERTVVIRLVHRLRDFLPVHIAENHRHVLPAEHLVVVIVTVGGNADALVANRLPWPIKRAVGEKDRLRLHSALPVLTPELKALICREALVFEGHQCKHRPIMCGLRRKQTIRIRLHRLPGTERAIVPRYPKLHIRTLDWLSGICIQHKALRLSSTLLRAHHDGEIAHPKVRKSGDVIIVAEVRIVTRNQKVEARFQIFGPLNFLHALAEIRRRRQLRRPCLLRLRREQRPALVVVQPLKIPVPF